MQWYVCVAYAMSDSICQLELDRLTGFFTVSFCLKIIGIATATTIDEEIADFLR
jgi:hypothetical protein